MSGQRGGFEKAFPGFQITKRSSCVLQLAKGRHTFVCNRIRSCHIHPQSLVSRVL